MANKYDSLSNAKAFEELRRMQRQQEENSVASKTQDRRYVGTKESVGFIVWTAAQGFNINAFSNRFITSIVGVDLGLQAVVNTINSVWDIVNDIFFGAVIDKTRTRWGKFRPYLMFLAIPGCILTCLYWLMPHLFEGTTQTDITKLAFYLILTIAREGITTFQTISRTGLMSTITPHPNDRTRLIRVTAFELNTPQRSDFRPIEAFFSSPYDSMAS